MITIINVSPKSMPLFGPNTYALLEKDELVCRFNHFKQPRDLVSCLRAAANALEAQEKLENFNSDNISHGVSE